MYPQNAYNLVSEIDPSKLEDLRKVLDVIQLDVENNAHFNFLDITSIHFARFVIIEATNGYHPYLAFETNYDGELNVHLNEIIRQTKSGGFDKVFGACKNFPSKAIINDADRLAFLKAEAHYHPYFYRGTWGRTVAHIRHEEKTRKDIQKYLDGNPALREKTTREIYEELKRKFSKPSPITQVPPTIAGLLLKIFFALILVVAICCLKWPYGFLALAATALTIYVNLRYKENKDKELVRSYDANTMTISLRDAEDKIVQNQLTHLVEIKEGWFRLMVLKAVLGTVETLGIYIFNKGNLGGIPSIHFARWIIIDKGKRLLFFSNFDGSWENYLGDFIDRAAVGLTAVWSNTKLFPRSKNLFQDGATDEQKFKSWTRMHQIPTQVWYSAYKYLTVENINNNTKIQEGFNQQLTDEQLNAWLQRL
jgi:hypothetical protein